METILKGMCLTFGPTTVYRQVIWLPTLIMVLLAGGWRAGDFSMSLEGEALGVVFLVELVLLGLVVLRVVFAFLLPPACIKYNMDTDV